MNATATLSSKLQTSIPKAVLEVQCCQPGQELAFNPKGKGVLLISIPERERLFGIAEGARAHAYRDRRDRC